ncbi:MAG: serine hydrolase domain-containing protein [Gemmatimonadota bacterium]
MNTHPLHPATGPRTPRAPAALLSLLLLVAAPGTPSLTAQEVAWAPAPGRWNGAVSDARPWLARHADSTGAPGLSVAVAVDGEVVWEEGFGFADLENRVPAWPESKFRVASISKAMTSIAVGLLVERGQLDLDAPVQRYVPSFPDKGAVITTRQLGGHLAGIRHYRGDEFASAVHYDDVVAALAVFQDDPLLSPPGERYSYSTYGWNLISAVVQSTAGRPFLDFMREEIIEPLNLRSTVAEHPDSILFHRARFYLRGDDGRLVNAPYVDNSVKWAGGGYLSTASDLVRLASALMDGDILRPETVDLLFRPQRTTAGESTGYGIGWFTREIEGRRYVFHTGGAMGGSTVLLMDPEHRVAVAILANLDSIGHTETAARVAARFARAR